MPHPRTLGFLLSGTLLASAGGLASQVAADATALPTAPVSATTPVLATPPASTPVDTAGSMRAGTTPSASTWTDTAFPIPAGAAGTARVAASSDDQELADWTVAPKTNGSHWRSGIAMVRHGAHLIHATTVPWSIAAAPTIAHSGSGLVLGTTRGPFASNALGWATVSPSGTVSQLTSLTKNNLSLDGAPDVSLAENASGAAVAAWVEGGGLATTVRAAMRLDGHHRFGKPFTLFTGTEASGVSTVIDGTGRAAVIYGARPAHTTAANRSIYAAVGLAGHRTLGTPIVAGPQTGNAQTDATFVKGGRLDIVWGSQPAGEEADGPYVVQASSLGRATRTFGPNQILDDGGPKAKPAAAPQIVPGPGTSSIVAWNAPGRKDDTNLVEVATSNPSGQFGAPQTLSTNAILGGVASNGLDAAVTLSPGDVEAGTTVSAAIKLPGGSFSAPGLVAPLAVADDFYLQPLGALKPAVVFSPTLVGDEPRALFARVVTGADGRPALVFTQHYV